MSRIRSAVACVAVGMCLVAGACAPGRGGDDQAALAPRPGQVTVTMADYRFVYANRVPAGRVVFKVANVGQWSHQLSLYALADDAPPIDAQLREPAGLSSAPLVVMPVLAAGAGGGSFAVDLVPGARYAMVSLWPSSQGVPDAMLGMATEFRAARPHSAATSPR